MAQIPTTFLILSDTHGESMPNLASLPPVDVAIHCGDLTEESKLVEFNSALDLLRSINADLKLVIAGNHDLSMDVPRFQDKIRDALGVSMDNGNGDENGEGMGSAATATATASVSASASPRETPRDTAAAAAVLQVATSTQGAAPPVAPISLDDIYQSFGYPGQVPSLFHRARNEGIIFLREGIHDFTLPNGAWLRVFASPFTASSASSPSSMGAFQYDKSHGHRFGMTRADNIDMVITHGPPHGILDRTEDEIRAGCTDLFEAVERVRPRVHCFGHVHEAWGAKMVTWRESGSGSGDAGERGRASHFTAIDNDRSFLVEALGTLRPGKWDSLEVVEEKSKKSEGYKRRGFCGKSFSMSPSPSMATAGNFSSITSKRNMAEMDGDGDVNLPDADAMVIDQGDLDPTVKGSLNGQTQIEMNQMDGDGNISNGETNSMEKGIPLEKGNQTLFVNAAIQGLDGEDGQQLPWIVTIDLPEAPLDGDWEP